MPSIIMLEQEQNNVILEKWKRLELEFRFFFKKTEQFLTDDNVTIEEKNNWKENTERYFNILISKLKNNLIEINNHLNS